MNTYTKDNPGSNIGLSKYLSEITGISEIKVIETNNKDDLYWHFPNRKRKRLLRYHSGAIECIKDGISYRFPASVQQRLVKIEDKDFMFLKDKSSYITLNRDFDFDFYKAHFWRPIQDFNIELKGAGSYKDCLGGGWYSKVQMFEHNGNYFAPNMEVSCPEYVL